MNTPPFLVGAALLFWGWQTGLVLPALFVALVLEASRVFTWRLEFSRTDFNRISDLCALLLIGSAVWVFALSGTPRAVGGPRAVTILFQRIPLLVALLVACQVYSTVGKVPLGALFWTLRKKAEREGVLGGTVDLAYPYVALCVLAASAANVRTPAFYIGLCLLAAWALWRQRSPRFSPLWWAPLLAVAVVLGYGGHLALHRAQLARAVAELLHPVELRADVYRHQLVPVPPVRLDELLLAHDSPIIPSRSALGFSPGVTSAVLSRGVRLSA